MFWKHFAAELSAKPIFSGVLFFVEMWQTARERRARYQTIIAARKEREAAKREKARRDYYESFKADPGIFGLAGLAGLQNAQGIYACNGYGNYAANSAHALQQAAWYQHNLSQMRR